jgi:hypothetical protein
MMLERAAGFAPLFADLRQSERLGSPSRDDDEVDARRDEIRHEPKTFPADALDPVALDGPADLPGDHEPEPAGRRQWPARDQEHEVRRGGAPRVTTARLDTLELRVTADLSCAPERLLRRRGQPGYFLGYFL